MKDDIVTSSRRRIDVLIAALLFAASAAVVIWQNSRLTILWDVSVILENATRIAAGDVPYRDFPLPYAPLTFAVQAAIIRFLGRAYWHHIAYATIACGSASALTYFAVRRLASPLLASVLCAPLAVLGIYCILPNPFYDPDCCLAVVALILIFLLIDRDSFVAGALFVVPLMIKQNIGLAFVAAALLLFALQRRWRSVAGIVCGIAVLAAAVAMLFGIGNYVRWTVHFAAARRIPPLSDMLSVYNDSDLWWWIAVVTAAIFIPRARWLMAIPFLWSEYRFFTTDDPIEPEINFLRVWPLFLVVGTIVAIAAWRRERGAVRILPLLIVAAVHGAFLSQITWGSTYGIWPLLVILMALVFRYAKEPLIPAAIIAAVLLHFGVVYVWNNQRLTYAKWKEGPMRTSSLPALRGLHMRGEWLPEFEELVAFAETHIGGADAVLCLPGEDLFYFATGRRPRVPVLVFDHTVNPYSPPEVASIAVAQNVRWVIVKRRLQINGDPYPELGETLRFLRAQFALAARLGNYDVYRRLSATASN